MIFRYLKGPFKIHRTDAVDSYEHFNDPDYSIKRFKKG